MRWMVDEWINDTSSGVFCFGVLGSCCVSIKHERCFVFVFCVTGNTGVWGGED